MIKQQQQKKTVVCCRRPLQITLTHTQQVYRKSSGFWYVIRGLMRVTYPQVHRRWTTSQWFLKRARSSFAFAAQSHPSSICRSAPAFNQKGTGGTEVRELARRGPQAESAAPMQTIMKPCKPPETQRKGFAITIYHIQQEKCYSKEERQK